MSMQYKPYLKSNSQELRRNMTKEERHLWYDYLKTLSVPVYRQHMIGPYIVDFYIPASSLIVELDGSQHYTEAGREKDGQRDSFFEEKGLTVLRYQNGYFHKHFIEVCEDIGRHLKK